MKQPSPWIGVLSLMLAGVLTLGGCSARMSPQEKEAGAPPMPMSPSQTAPMAAEEGVMSYRADSADAAKSQGMGGNVSAEDSATSALLQPQVIKTASVSLRVDNMKTAMKALEQLTAKTGGIITNQSLSLAGEGGSYHSGTLQVRVPAARLQAFLDALEETGTVLDLHQEASDVGGEIVDNDARIRNKKAEEQSLQTIMQRTGKIAEILEVSRELARVRGEIEQLESRQAYLKQQVAYSTVNLSLSQASVGAATHGKPGLFTVIGNAFNQALEALYELIILVVQAVTWLLIFFIPLLLVLGVVGFVLFKWVLSRLFQAIANGVTKLFAKIKSL